MKKRLTLGILLALTTLFVSCMPENKEYSPDQLVGKWVKETEYYRFDSDMNGATWDTADDVSEEEAQPFEWMIEEDQLTVIHKMEMGGVVPKTYTIEDLTADKLTLTDNYAQKLTYSRVAD